MGQSTPIPVAKAKERNLQKELRTRDSRQLKEKERKNSHLPHCMLTSYTPRLCRGFGRGSLLSGRKKSHHITGNVQLSETAKMHTHCHVVELQFGPIMSATTKVEKKDATRSNAATRRRRRDISTAQEFECIRSGWRVCSTRTRPLLLGEGLLVFESQNRIA